MYVYLSICQPDMSLSGEAVLYAASPSDKRAQESARRERRRRKVIKELFETEKTYLQHLELVYKVRLLGKV